MRLHGERPTWADLEYDDVDLQSAHPSAVPISAALKTILNARPELLSQIELEWIDKFRQQRGIPDKAYRIAVPSESVHAANLHRRCLSDNLKAQARDFVDAAFYPSVSRR